MKQMELTLSILVFIISATWLCSCAVLADNKPRIQERLAEVVVRDRKPNGQFDSPSESPFGGAKVVAKRVQYFDENGRHFFGEKMQTH